MQPNEGLWGSLGNENGILELKSQKNGNRFQEADRPDWFRNYMSIPDGIRKYVYYVPSGMFYVRFQDSR